MEPENVPITPITPENLPVHIIPTKKSKLPLIWGVIILIGITGGLGFWGGRYLSNSKTSETVQPIVMVTTTTPTPTADPTANWKIYTNIKNEYSLKYPEESSYIGLESVSAGFEAQYCPGIKEKGSGRCGAPGYNYFVVYVDENQTNKTLEERIKENNSYKIPECIKNDPRTKIIREKFQGLDSIKYEYTLDKEAKNTYCKNEYIGVDEHQEIVFIHNKKLFVLAIVNATKEAKTELNKIISTFKFLNEPTNVNTPGTINSYSGTLQKTISRPAPDIAYDYEIVLDQPLTGITTGAGDNQTLTKIIAVGTNIDFENYVGKHINFTASLDWGYVESKVFNVTKIIQSN